MVAGARTGSAAGGSGRAGKAAGGLVAGCVGRARDGSWVRLRGVAAASAALGRATAGPLLIGVRRISGFCDAPDWTWLASPGLRNGP